MIVPVPCAGINLSPLEFAASSRAPNFGTGSASKMEAGTLHATKKSNPPRVSLNKRNNLQIHAAINLQKRRIEYMYMNNTDENIDSPGHRLVDRPMTVADVMTRHVITLNPHHSFSDSVSLMAKHSFRHFLVADTAGRLVGVVRTRHSTCLHEQRIGTLLQSVYDA
jgi:CBS-domain-containing membrane protein